MLTNPETRATAYIGIATVPVSKTLAEQLGLQPGMGLAVDSVDPQGPGVGLLQPQDVVRELEGQVLFNRHQFSGILRTYAPGQTVVLKISRQTVLHSVEIKLGSRPGNISAHPYWGSRHRLNLPIPGADLTVTNWSEPLRLDESSINEILAHIQHSHEERIPERPVEARSMDAFMGDIREKLESVQWKPPLSPKAYRRARKIVTTNELYFGADSDVLSISDEKMSAKMTVGDQGSYLIVEDTAGNIVFEGPVNTREERMNIPGQAYKYMDHLENLREYPGTPVMD